MSRDYKGFSWNGVFITPPGVFEETEDLTYSELARRELYSGQGAGSTTTTKGSKLILYVIAAVLAIGIILVVRKRRG